MCKRQDEFNPSSHHVCSNHFDKQNDFEPDIQSQIMGCKPRNILKVGVIPNKNLPRSSLAPGSMKITTAGEKRKMRMEKKQEKKVKS